MEGGNCIRSNVRHIPRLEHSRDDLRFGPYCCCLNFSVKFIPLCSSVGMFLGDLVTWTVCRVRVVGQAMDRGQVIYVDEMCLFWDRGRDLSVFPFISSVCRTPGSDQYAWDPWGK